jgi:hypothetical protein
VVVLPTSVAEPPDGLLGPWPLAIIFATATLIASLGANGVGFLSAFLTGDRSAIDAGALASAVPGTAALFAILGEYPGGHGPFQCVACHLCDCVVM